MIRPTLTALLVAALAGCGGPSDVQGTVVGYRYNGINDQIVLVVEIGVGDRVQTPTVISENPAAVTVSVRVKESTGDRNDIGLLKDAVVQLEAPLGHREVRNFAGNLVPLASG